MILSTGYIRTEARAPSFPIFKSHGKKETAKRNRDSSMGWEVLRGNSFPGTKVKNMYLEEMIVSHLVVSASISLKLTENIEVNFINVFNSEVSVYEE